MMGTPAYSAQYLYQLPPISAPHFFSRKSTFTKPMLSKVKYNIFIANHPFQFFSLQQVSF
jgi:hypothetical protein